MSLVRLDAPKALGRLAPDPAAGEKRPEPQAGSLFAALLAATLVPAIQGGAPAAQAPPAAAGDSEGAAAPVEGAGAVAAALLQRAAAPQAVQGSGAQTVPASASPVPNLQGDGAGAGAAAEAVAEAVATVLPAEDAGAPRPILDGPAGELATGQSSLPTHQSGALTAPAAVLPHPAGQAAGSEPDVESHPAVQVPTASEAVHPAPAEPVGQAVSLAPLPAGDPELGEQAGNGGAQAGGEEPGRTGPQRDSAPEVPAAPVDLHPTGEILSPSPDSAPGAPVAREAAAQSTPAPQLYQVQEPVAVEQVMDLVVESLGEGRDGDQTVTLKLHPEHLGEVRLHLQLSGREVRTLFEVSTPEARQALEQRGDELRQGLSQAGFTLSGFSVSTGDGRRQSWERRELEELLWRGRTERQVPRAAAAPAQMRSSSRVQHNGLLDRMA